MEKSVDIYVHEHDMARMERSNARAHFLCIILLIVLLATNGAWLYYESQYTDITTTIESTQDGSGTNIVTGGDINYGAESQSNN